MSGVLLFAGMALLGLPALSGFVGELLAFMALFGKYPVVTIIGALGIILAAAYVLRGILRITFGPLAEGLENKQDARWIEAIPMVVLMAFIVLLGVYPTVVTELTQSTISAFVDFILRNGG
jgi:NADH-quinone oxidoreductase subunit M